MVRYNIIVVYDSIIYVYYEDEPKKQVLLETS